MGNVPSGQRAVNAQDKEDIIDSYQRGDLDRLIMLRDRTNPTVSDENKKLAQQYIDKLKDTSPGLRGGEKGSQAAEDDANAKDYMEANPPNKTKLQALLDRKTPPIGEALRERITKFLATGRPGGDSDRPSKSREHENPYGERTLKKRPTASALDPSKPPDIPLPPGADINAIHKAQINSIKTGADSGPNEKRQNAIAALEAMIALTNPGLNAENKALAQSHITDLQKQIVVARDAEHFQKIKALYEAKKKDELIAFRTTANLSVANKNYLETCISALSTGSGTGDGTGDDEDKPKDKPDFIVPPPFGMPPISMANPEIVGGGVTGGRKRKFATTIPSIDKFITEDTWQSVRGMVDNLKRYSGIDVTPELTAKILYNYAKRQEPGSVVGKASEFIGMLPFDYGLSNTEKQTLQKAVQYLEQGRDLGQSISNFDVPKLLNYVNPTVLKDLNSYKDQTQKRRKGLRYKPLELVEKSLQDYATNNANSIITKGLVAAQQTGVADFLRNTMYDKMDSIVGNRR